jgi:hypothetical protein
MPSATTSALPHLATYLRPKSDKTSRTGTEGPGVSRLVDSNWVLVHRPSSSQTEAAVPRS